MWIILSQLITIYLMKNIFETINLSAIITNMADDFEKILNHSAFTTKRAHSKQPQNINGILKYVFISHKSQYQLKVGWFQPGLFWVSGSAPSLQSRISLVYGLSFFFWNQQVPWECPSHCDGTRTWKIKPNHTNPF